MPFHLTSCAGRPLGKGMKMAGRAVTVRFVPQRPDIAADKPPGVNSPEYEAFEKCGPKEVIEPRFTNLILPHFHREYARASRPRLESDTWDISRKRAMISIQAL